MSAPGDPPPRRTGALRWCFEHRESGEIVVAQWPNLPLWIFILGYLAQAALHPKGRAGTILIVVTALGLTWWALDEVIRGCNPWRRLIGAAVLIFELYHFWRILA